MTTIPSGPMHPVPPIHTMARWSESEGTQEWRCAHCDRVVLIEWEPQFQRIVLKPGDTTISHRGGLGGLIVDGATTHPQAK